MIKFWNSYGSSLLHLSGFLQSSMEGEGVIEKLRLMSTCLRDGTIKVTVEQGSKLWMGTAIDDESSSFAGVKTPKVCIALFCYNQRHLMLCMIDMGHHGDDTGDIRSLCDGRGEKCGDGTISCKFDRTGYSGQDPSSSDMCRIDVAVDVDFNRSIEGNHTQSLDHFRAATDVERSDHQYLLVPVQVLEETGKSFLGEVKTGP